MAGKPKNFQAISNVLANYNFVDIAAGTGYINFYAGTTVDKYLLSNFTYYADTIVEAQVGSNEADYTLYTDLDFDTVINRPLDAKGLGIVNIPYAGSAQNGNLSSGYVKVILRKWDGVTETDICTNDSRVYNTSGVTYPTYTYTMFSVDLTVPLTHFKIGETLRLTVQIYLKRTDALGLSYGKLAHDPKGRTTGWDSTGAVPSQLVFQCPVRLNL